MYCGPAPMRTGALYARLSAERQAKAYLPDRLVKAEDAPKSYTDLLNPLWADAIDTKRPTSGLQHLAWYTPRRRAESLSVLLHNRFPTMGRYL